MDTLTESNESPCCPREEFGEGLPLWRSKHEAINCHRKHAGSDSSDAEYVPVTFGICLSILGIPQGFDFNVFGRNRYSLKNLYLTFRKIANHGLSSKPLVPVPFKAKSQRRI